MSIFGHFIQRKKLVTAFKLAGVYRTFKTDNGERKVFPKIHNVPNEDYNYFVFTLPNGVDPKLLKKNFFVFQQVFGGSVVLEGDHKRFKLSIREHVSIPKIDYDFEQIKKAIEKEKAVIPIVCGADVAGGFTIYDATNSPNLLIYGEPGSGKSSILHVILTTFLRIYKPGEIELYLADFKMSELNLYEGVEQVKSVSYMEKEFGPVLRHLKKELTKRGQLLKKYSVRHINKLPNEQKPPYIVLCVDEFVMIRNEDIMTDLLQIASLGRAYGIYLILSMQRPSHKILSTDVRGLLSVRMGFRTVDKRNAMIGETPGSELIPKKGAEGTFLLKLDDLMQLRAPYLNEDQTEEILKPFKRDDWKNHNYTTVEQQQEQPQQKEKGAFDDDNK